MAPDIVDRNLWTPAAVMGVVAFLANQYAAWRKERRDAHAAQVSERDTEEDRDDKRYREHIDAVVKALERRVSLAEENESDCIKDRLQLRDELDRVNRQCTERIKAAEDMISALSRKIANAS